MAQKDQIESHKKDFAKYLQQMGAAVLEAKELKHRPDFASEPATELTFYRDALTKHEAAHAQLTVVRGDAYEAGMAWKTSIDKIIDANEKSKASKELEKELSKQGGYNELKTECDAIVQGIQENILTINDEISALEKRISAEKKKNSFSRKGSKDRSSKRTTTEKTIEKSSGHSRDVSHDDDAVDSTHSLVRYPTSRFTDNRNTPGMTRAGGTKPPGDGSTLTTTAGRRRPMAGIALQAACQTTAACTDM